MTKNSPTKTGINPLLRGFLYVIGGLLVLLLLLQIAISLFADDYVANILKDQVRESSDSTYMLTFEDLDLNVFSGSATIVSPNIQADTSVFRAPSSSSAGVPPVLFQGTFDEIEINGVDVFSSLLGNELRIGSIRLSRPDISAFKNPHDGSTGDNVSTGNDGSTGNNGSTGNKSTFTSIDSTLFAVFSGQYKAVEIDEITIQQGSGLLSVSGDTRGSIGQLDLSLRDIRVDSTSAQSGRTFITDDLSLDIRSFRMQLPDSLNTVAFSRLAISSEEQAIIMDSLQLIPRYGKMEFARRNGSPIDRIDLNIPNIQFKDVDVSRFVDSARIYARYVLISDPAVEDYYNRGIEGGPPTYSPLPMSSFRELKTLIKVDSLRVKDAFISYAEYVGGTPRAGEVTFESLEGIFINISNYPEDIEDGLITTLDAQARVMGNGVLEAHFKFPMDTKNDFHEVEGRLERMPMTDFNRMMEHVAFIRIDRGLLNSLEFEMRLRENKSSGSVIMNYKNFKISVLDKQTIQQRGLLENMATFVANNFIAKEDNTPEAGMQAGQVQFERDKSKGIFNFWWKSLLSGIKDSIKK